MAMTYTNEQIANDFTLWSQYVDPNATTTREEFDRMTVEERLAVMAECGFEDASTDED